MLKRMWAIESVVTTLILMLGVSVAPDRAYGEDDGPTEPRGCALAPGGVEVPTGSVVPFGPGTTPGGGAAGMYMCVDGQWILVLPTVGPGGVIFMEFGPRVSVDYDEYEVDAPEGTTATHSGLVLYDGDEELEMEASVGQVTRDGPIWQWSYDTSDGPAQSQDVAIYALAGDLVGALAFELTVTNVAPTVTAVTPDAAVALLGEPVVFTGVATDPSAEDTEEGFTWTFDGVDVADYQLTTSFNACGWGTVAATATDKDGGTSASVESDPVLVAEANFERPLVRGAELLVRAGQVVPVRVAIGCNGVAVTGLAPVVTLIPGNVENASGFDLTGVMRETDFGYGYDLRIPNAPSGSTFTVVVHPSAGSGSMLSAGLRIR